MNIEDANRRAMERLLESKAVLIGMKPALDVVPGMKFNSIFHAGPPIPWQQMCGPMQSAIIGAAIFEGLVSSPEEVAPAIQCGNILLDANHNHSTVGGMAGVISASMPVYIVKNTPYGNIGFVNIHEGLGKVLAMGAYNQDVLDNLKVLRDIVGPALGRAIESMQEINLTALISEGILRGDELHNRCKASTSLFLEMLVPALLKTSKSNQEFLQVYEKLRSNTQTMATPAMGACKVTMDAIVGLEGSTIMTAYARNGATVGIRVSGLGDRWFIAPAPYIQGAYFPGYCEKDANPDIGDSAITETGGLGAFAQAAAPSISQLVGRSARDSINFSLSMYEITLGEHRFYQIPSLDFRGSPFGVDVRKVVETGILPICNTAISHKEPGIGMIGAGMVSPPMSCFEQAVMALAEQLG